MAKSFFVRPVIHSMEGYAPGEQPRDRRYIKLNTNENPYPPSPKVLAAIQAAVTDDLRLYPDPGAHELRKRAAEVYAVPAEQIIAGNGSDDLLAMLFRACVETGATRQVAYAVPTYSLYDTLALIQDSNPCTVPFPADFVLPARELLAMQTRLTIICSPNSPSGTVIPLPVIEEFARAAPGLVVVDEAYVDFARETALSLLATCPNIFVLRTFSKSFSLAGMRIGLGFGSLEVISELNKVRDSYNLDRLSLVAARAALDDVTWMKANVAKVVAARDELLPELGKLGLSVLPSESNFVFAQTPSGDAAGLYQALRDRGILVRYFATPALRGGIRISVGTPEENGALLAALRDIAAGR